MQSPRQAATREYPPPDPEDDFSNELFVRLLLELPAHRRDIAESWQAGDLQRLEVSTAAGR